MMEDAAKYLYLWITEEEPRFFFEEEGPRIEHEREIIIHALTVQHLNELEMRKYLVPLWMTRRDYQEFLGLFFVPSAI